MAGIVGMAGNVVGGGNKKGNAPPPPDYSGAATQTAVGNHPNQTSPWASSQWSMDPSTGQFSQTLGLNPTLQGAATGFEQQLGQASSPDARNSVINALYGQQTSRLDPMWNQREQGMNTGMANQGLSPGDFAYNQQQGNFGRSRNDAYQTAANNATLMGGQEQQRQQQMAMGGLQGLQGLMQMPNAPQGANQLAAAGMQGQYGLAGQQMNNQAAADYWSAIMGAGMGGAKLAMGGGG